MRRHHAIQTCFPLAATALALTLGLSACAIPGAPYIPTQPQAKTCAPTLRIEEVRPTGVLLQASADGCSGDLDLVHIDADSYTSLHTFSALPKPSTIMDPLRPGETRHYALVHQDAIAELSVTLPTTFPTAPDQVEATVIGQYVRLRWTCVPGSGYLVFARRLGTPYQRVWNTLQQDTCEVLIPRQPGVHSFLVSTTTRGTDAILLGHPSAEALVVVRQP